MWYSGPLRPLCPNNYIFVSQVDFSKQISFSLENSVLLQLVSVHGNQPYALTLYLGPWIH